MTAAPGHDDALPYREATSDAYATAAAGTFGARRLAEGVSLLTGPCPRCRAVISVHLVNDVLRRGVRRRARQAPPQPYRTVRCNCRAPHPGRPESLRGCGAYWNVLVEQRRQP
ncbi:hypothetical protein ACFWFZ_30475 [Streptomyces sp. NPDC060232]|uniref:hypothetical protein n=1 Tax=Streptomyces sp. NPDC060232 TaxID=3347079 RepID=UPI00365E25EF